MIQNKHHHYDLLSTFLSKKVSASPDNTSFTFGGIGEVYQGTPDIPWRSIVYVKETGWVWTHGKIYDASGEASKLKAPVKINGTSFDGTQDIVTEKWGHLRKISTTDGTNTSDSIEVDGSEDISIPLPSLLDVRVTKDMMGREITETYPTREELENALDELESFFVYSGADESYPALETYPANTWTTPEEKEIHAGDFFVTTEGRIFRFTEDPKNGWEWKEITDFYLYDCLGKLKDVQKKVDISGRWDEPQTTAESSEIDVHGVSLERKYLDILCCPGYVEYNLKADTNIYLPYAYGNNWTRTKTRYFGGILRLLRLVDILRVSGKSITVLNRSTTTKINMVLGNTPEGIDQSVSLNPGKLCTLTLKVELSGGNLVFYWVASEIGEPGLATSWI